MTRGIVIAVVCLALAGCGNSSSSTAGSSEVPDQRTPLPAPRVTLTAAEKQVWAPLPADRSAIPVLLYHGIGPASDFANSADASYGVDVIDFAKQMTMIKHAGYQTVSLQTFIDFVEGKNVKLPRRPLLLTFDDARADSYTGSDGILKKLGFNAVMFADVGRVDDGDPEYLTWDELRTMASSGRWDMQLHSGHGHVYIQYDSSDPAVTGPYYAYQKPGEDLDAWKKRVTGDIEWGEQQLSRQIPGIQPLAFSPPYGSYGQDGTNDPSIPGALLGYLTDRFHVVFTQDENARAKPGAPEPLGRIQVTRAVAGGDLYERLLSGKN